MKCEFPGSIMRATALIMTTLAINAGPDVCAQDPSVTDVFDAWKQRTARARTGRFSWNEEKLLVGGNRVGFGGMAMQPPADTVVQDQLSVIFDERRMIYHYFGHQWDPNLKKVVPHEYHSTFDGEDMVLYFPPQGGDPRGDASIRSKEQHPDAENIHVKAVLLAFRPLDPMLLRLGDNEYEIGESGLTIGDVPCVIVQQTADYNLRRRLWTDPARDFLLLRYQELVHDKQIINIDITYEEISDPEGPDHVPVSWKADWYNADGSLDQSFTASMSESEVNVPVEDDEFRIQFAPGTMVIDQLRDTEYIAREGGEKRLITKAELGRATYEELLNTETGEAEGPALKRNPPSLLIAVNAIVVVALIVLIIKRKANAAPAANE